MMRDQSPRVSIGMPVYNGERFLRETLDSVLAQSFTDFELIISDNASTDDTAEISHEYARRDRRIRYFRNETNVGSSRNHKRVFALSSGEYFKWWDADDLCAPDYLQKCVTVLDEQPGVVLCYPKSLIIDENSQIVRPHEDNLDIRSYSVVERFKVALFRTNLCNPMYGLIRRDVLRKTSVMGNFPGADEILLVELTLYGQLWEVPERLYFRRVHAQASSSKRSLQDQQEFHDPQTRGKIFLRLWTHYFHHLVSILRSPLQSMEKARLLGIVARTAIWNRQQLLTELGAGFSRKIRVACRGGTRTASR